METKRLKLPYGIADFASLRQEGREQLQKYCQFAEIADKMADKKCPLKPYLIIFSGCKCSHFELFEINQNTEKTQIKTRNE